MKEDTPKNKSTSKTLAILSTFTENEPMQKTSDIAKKLKLNMSTVSRHLNTLLDEGYLERDWDTGFYYPSLKIVALAGATLHNKPEYRYTYPYLQKLSNRYQVHTHMSIREDIDIMHLISVSCEYTKELAIPMGHRQPLYCSAMGRVILSDMTDRQVDDILKNSNLIQYTPNTIIEKEKIKKNLVKIRKQGYCVLKDELVHGKASIATPLRNSTRKIIGAISASTSLDDLEKDGREKELIKAITYIGSKISGQLGYYP